MYMVKVENDLIIDTKYLYIDTIQTHVSFILKTNIPDIYDYLKGDRVRPYFLIVLCYHYFVVSILIAHMLPTN